jgi:hypothetical protein
VKEDDDDSSSMDKRVVGDDALEYERKKEEANSYSVNLKLAKGSTSRLNPTDFTPDWDPSNDPKGNGKAKSQTTVYN